METHPRSEKTLDWFVPAGDCAMLGEKEKALEYLEKAYSARLLCCRSPTPDCRLMLCAATLGFRI